MKKTLLNFLKIRENEAYKVFQFFLLAIFLQAGVAIGETIANSMFLVHIGFDKLPIIYILTSIIMLVVYIPIYTFFTNKYGEEKFFFFFLIFLSIVNLIILFFIQNSQGFLPEGTYEYVFYFLLLYTTVVVITVYTLLWNFIDMFYDIIDSKRVFSIFSAGTAIGAIVGGSIVTLSTQYFPAEITLGIWSVFTILALFVYSGIRKNFKKIDDIEEEEDEESLAKMMISMFKNMKSSTYTVLLSFVFFISIFAATVLEFEYMNILSKGQSVESLALLFGQLFVAVNIFNLIVNFFIFNRLVISFGVKNVLIIQPIVYILVFLFLSVEIGIEAGILGFFVVQGMLVSIDYNNQNLLYNGISKKTKYQVRTFIESLGEPLTLSLAGVFLLIVGTDYTVSEIALISLLVAFVYLILAFMLRHQYSKAMSENLKEDWLDLGRNENKVLLSLPLEEQKDSIKYLSNKNNSAIVSKIVSMYSYSEAIQILLPYLNNVNESMFKKNKKFLLELLNSNYPEVTKSVIDWLDQKRENISIYLEKELASRNLLSYETAFNRLEDRNSSIASVSASVILDSQYPDHINKAINVVEKLLQSGENKDIIEALYILSNSKHERYAFFAAEFLGRFNHTITVCALETIYDLCNTNSSKLVKPVLDIFNSGSKIERKLSLDILSKIEDTQSILPLFKDMNILTAYEKRQVISLIENIGLQAVPIMVTILQESSFSYTGRSIAARTLGGIAFEQFKTIEEKLIYQELEKVYKYLQMYTIVNESYEKTNNVHFLLLSKYYKDNQQVILDFILENLTVGGEMESFELIKTSLRSSNSKVRGNAIETIEQSTKKSIFRLLLPLLDGRSASDVMSFYKANFEFKEYSLDEILLQSFFSHNQLEIVLSIQLIRKYEKNYLEIFREQLLNKKSTKLIKDTILYELTDDKNYINVVHKLAKLVENEFMKHFSIFSIYLMLKNSSIQDCEKNYLIHDQNLYYLVEGKVKYQNKIYKQGDIVGQDTLFSKENIEEIHCQEKTKLLKINKSNIIDAIEIYPEIGIEFFKV
jgi:Na+/melibiose symporter-like transporter